VRFSIRTLALAAALIAAGGCHDRAPGGEAHGAASTSYPASGRAARQSPPHTSGTPPEPEPARVRLVAKSKLGVPLHDKPGTSSVSARLPDGSEVRVEARDKGGHWLSVRAADGTHGWITERYVGSASKPQPIDSSSVWASDKACEAALAAGRHAPRAAGRARIGTWNLRWFPDGHPGTHPHGPGTDLAWLSCGIAWLDVDVLAVQEIKRYPAARARMGELLTRLDRLTHGRWRARFDDCPDEAAQHVGLLYNSARVNAADFHTFAALNPYGEACKDLIRPGLGGYFRFKGGLDLHVIAVHLKSGDGQRSIDLRRRSIAGIAAAYREAQGEEADRDVLLAGDFNTMGCPHCSPPVAAPDETKELGRAAAALSPAFTEVGTDGGCSEYYRGHGGLLDHFLATRSLREIPSGTHAVVAGYCAAASCSRLPAKSMPAAYARLSDHCPVLLDLADRDLD
jgi:endonuclease/exonuclease/phosphatase family metal-dependent hydrolase